MGMELALAGRFDSDEERPDEVAAAAASSLTDGTVTTCTFKSRSYAEGDVWYPRLGQPGALHCVACVCQEVSLLSYYCAIVCNVMSSKCVCILFERAGRSIAPFRNVAARIASIRIRR